VTREQAAARAALLKAWGRAIPSDILFRAIIYADAEHRHTRGIALEIRRLRKRVAELEIAAIAWAEA
jgi:hypothetical protein